MSRGGRRRRLRTLTRLPWLVLKAGRAGAGRAVGPLAVWAGWERLMLALYRVEPVRPGGLLLFRVQRHRGADARLADGTVVRRGALVVELHFDNRGLIARRRERDYGTWRTVRTLREDVRALGGRIAAGELGAIAAIHGLSLLGAAGGILGFEARELPHTWRMAFVRYFMTGIDAIYHPAGLRRLDSRAGERWPVELWMSARAAAGLARRETA